MRNTGRVEAADLDADPPDTGAEHSPAGPAECGPAGDNTVPDNTADAAAWEWAGRLGKYPDDVPLHGLMLSATRLMGAYGKQTVQSSGLKASLAGLGVLRVLMVADGLKATEVADRSWTTPGTMTAVVATLVRDGLVERRPDETDRRVVRLYITDAGRAVITSYVNGAAEQWRKAFDFVNEADEAVVRRFFVQLIDHLSQLTREERGR
jgi:DNA-binding MarR family transcriptional regulator